MRKQTLLASASRRFYRPSIRLGRHGHPMRDPEGHGDSNTGGGGNESQTGNDNQGGNPGNSGTNNNNAGNQQNNGGNNFDPSSFWNDPQPENPTPSNNGGSAGGNQGQGTGESQGNQGGNAFAQALAGMSFGNDVFSADAIEKMNNGDPSQFNTNLTQFGRDAVKQAVVMAAQLMQRNNQEMQTRFQAMMEEQFGNRDTAADLSSAFPSYKNPAVKPVIDGIMAQALKLSKGNRPAAIEMTKTMMQFQAKTLGDEFGITNPPRDPGNNYNGGGSTNWAEELLGRD